MDISFYREFNNPNSQGCVQNRIQIGGFGTVMVDLWIVVVLENSYIMICG